MFPPRLTTRPIMDLGLKLFQMRQPPSKGSFSLRNPVESTCRSRGPARGIRCPPSVAFAKLCSLVVCSLAALRSRRSLEPPRLYPSRVSVYPYLRPGGPSIAAAALLRAVVPLRKSRSALLSPSIPVVATPAVLAKRTLLERPTEILSPPSGCSIYTVFVRANGLVGHAVATPTAASPSRTKI